MGYDDKNFQSQNVHVAGDENTKMPSGLCLYALPKFDLDDSLQVHSTFDNLVESEVLVGIQSQEENQWIEDFSRGNKEIEISSTAAESSSTSNRNNVCSEAASLKSAEMLLKSVGQDVMISEQFFSEIPGTSSGMDSLTNQVEFNSRRDGFLLPKIVDAAAANLTLGPDSFLKSFSGSTNDAVGQLSQVETTSHANDAEKFIHGNSEDLDSNSFGETSIIALTEESLLIDEKCDKAKQKEESYLGDVSEGKNTLDTQEALHLMLEGDNCLKEHASEITHSNAGILPDSARKMDSSAQISQRNSSVEFSKIQGGLPSGNIHHLESGNLVSSTESYLLSSEEKTVSEGKRDESRNPLSLVVACSSPSKIHESQPNEIIKDGDYGLALNKADLGAEVHTSSFMQVDSMQICDKNLLGSGSSDDHITPDAFIIEKKNSGSSADSGHVEGEIDGCLIEENRVASSSLCLSTATTTVMNRESLSDRIVGEDTEEAIKSVSETSNLASQNKFDIHHQSVENINAADEVIGRIEDVNSPLVVNDLDKKKGTITTISTGSPLMETVPLAVFEQGVVCEDSGELLTKTVQGSSSLEAVGTRCQSEIQIPTTTVAVQEWPKDLEGCHFVHDSVAAEDDGAGGVSCENCKGAALEVAGTNPSHAMLSTVESHNSGQKEQEDNEVSLIFGDKSGGQNLLANTEGKTLVVGSSREENVESEIMEPRSINVNTGEPTCGSPIVISCSEPSQGEKEHLEGGVCSDKKTPVSDCKDKEFIKARSATDDLKQNGAPEDAGNFTFEVNPALASSERGADSRWKHFSSKLSEFHQTVEDSPKKSSLSQMDTKMLQEIPGASFQASGGKGTAGKTQSYAGKSTETTNTAKDGKVLKETTSLVHKKERRGNLGSESSSSLGSTSPVVPAKEMHPNGHIEGSSTKLCSVPTVQATPPSSLFQRPFKQHQHAQLRAQIYIYGSLVQGTPLDEEFMCLAFGGPDGGRTVWENLWRVATERLRKQKSPLSNPQIMQSNSGGTLHQQAMRQSALQTGAPCTPAGRAGGRGLASTVNNSIMSVSSPLWTVPTPTLPNDGSLSSSMSRGSLLDSHQTLPLVPPYQSPQVGHYVGNTSLSFSQVHSPGLRVFSPQTPAFGARAHCSVSPISEAIDVTSVRQSSEPHPSGIQHVPSSPWSHAGPLKIFPSEIPPMETKSPSLSLGNHSSADLKPRKGGNSIASEEHGKISSVQIHTEPVCASSHPSISVAVISPVSAACKVGTSGVVSTSPLTSSTGDQTIWGCDMEQWAIFSDESCSRIEQAKQQAENAAALAASALRHSQSVWSQLAIQKNSRLGSDAEVKLTSAAVAVAAASSVAKAAAAAAQVASDAALQAKLMADEAFSSNSRCSIQSSESSLFDSVNNSGKVIPASVLKGKGRANNSNKFISEETLKKSAETASADSKRSENLDAVLKAAKLAAEAVSQAGAIISMGEPIPLTLTELVEAGPDGYWRIHHFSSKPLLESNNITKGERGSIDCNGPLDMSGNHCNVQPSCEKVIKPTVGQEKVPHLGEISRHSGEGSRESVSNMHCDSVTNCGLDLGGQNVPQASELSKSIGVVPESEIGPSYITMTVRDGECEGRDSVETSKEDYIKQGSQVEVFSNEEGFRGGWFPAKVLNLKEGKAHVLYSVILKDKGSEYLKEWVPLKGEGGKAPRIRLTESMTSLELEGTKKRRREARGDHTWCVGDRVDAHIHDGWWEGVITETSKGDETGFSVHFPAQGHTLIVQASNLRPSLIWENGHWMEWSRSRDNSCYAHEGDTPLRKRVKLSSHNVEVEPALDVRGKNMSKHAGNVESEKPQALRPLSLSAKENIFTIGKNTRDGKSSDTTRTKRPGLQKDGSRVIFGVPEPGKKGKFMEVSNHFVSNRGVKSSEGHDSMRISKNSIQQESKSYGTKNVFKVESKGKRVAETKLMVPNERKKVPRIPTKSISEKDSSSTSVYSALDDGIVPHLPEVKASVGPEQNILENKNLLEIGSLPNPQKGSTGPISFTKLDIVSDAASKRKTSTVVEADVGKKGNVASEPRRSNRQFQPTSRLLEGLETSFISKIPFASHDKGRKPQHRSTSLRGNKQS